MRTVGMIYDMIKELETLEIAYSALEEKIYLGQLKGEWTGYEQKELEDINFRILSLRNEEII